MHFIQKEVKFIRPGYKAHFLLMSTYVDFKDTLKMTMEIGYYRYSTLGGIPSLILIQTASYTALAFLLALTCPSFISRVEKTCRPLST